MHRVVRLAVALVATALLLLPIAAKAYDVTVTIGVGDTILRVFGKTSPGAFVTIKKDGGVIGTVLADAAGEYGQTFPAQDPGISQLNLYAHTTNSQTTDTVTIYVNIAEHATTSVGVFLPSTLQIANANLALGEQLIINGETAPASTVSIYIDNANYATATSDAQGLWQAAIATTGLTVGQHELFIRVADTFGEQSYPTTPRYFFVPAQPQQPAPPATPGLPVPRPPTITFPQPGTVWHEPAITIQGTAGGNVQIELWDGNTIIGSVWSGGQGSWSIPVQLQLKDYELRARACADLRCSGFSATVRFRYEPGGMQSPGDQVLRIIVPQSSFVVYQRQVVQLRATVVTGQPPYQTTIQWGDGRIERRAYTQNDLLFPHMYDKPGQYTVAVEVQDATGQKNKIFFTVDVKAVDAPSFWWLFWLPILIVLAAVAWWLVVLRKKRRKQHGRNRKAN